MLKIKEIESDIQNLLKTGCSKIDLANFIREKTKLKETQVRFYTRHFWGPDESKEGIKIEKSSTEQTLQYAGDDLINVENLLKKCNVDSKKWEVSKFTLEEKHITKKIGDSIEFVPKYDVRAWLEKKVVDQDELLKEFIQEAAKHSPTNFEYKKLTEDKTRKYLLELAILDLHLAKLAQKRETGWDNYDIKIAVDLYRKAVNDLLSKAPLDEISEIVFPVGNDFFNSDNELYTTTSGTPQHDDSRWHKSFTVGCNLMTETIERLTTICDKVTVLIVAGNHDRQKVFYLGEYLSAWFKNNKRVIVENSPNNRKYFTFGRCLLGYAHGCDEKHADLPLIMAREQPKAWGECKHYRWAIGHYHHITTKDYKGVMVDILPSLCASDSWHSRKGFVANWRGSQAFLYDGEEGLTAVYYHRVNQPS
jgi:hypothetical protein